MKRISTPEKAHNLVNKLIELDEGRAVKRRKVDGMIAGNPPYDPRKLAEIGQAHRTNVNFREAEGIINLRNASFFHLFLNGKYLIEAKLVDADDPRFQGQARFYHGTMSQELSRVLRKWDDFEFEMMTIGDSMTTHGDAFPLWFDKDDWKWRTYETGSVLFPRNTKASAGYIKGCVILDELTVEDLFEREQDEKAEENGWNKTELRRAIKDSLEKNGQAQEDWTDIQTAIENDSLAYEDVLASNIKIAHVITVEKDTKISHHIIERGKTESDFLFKEEGAYEEITDLMIPFICNRGNGYFHGLKGIGHRIFPTVMVNNRFLCRAVDAAQDSGSMVLGFPQGTDRKGKLLRMGNTIILPAGAEVQQQYIQQNVQGITGVYQLLTGVNQASVGVKRPGVSAIAQNEKAKYSARGESMQALEEVELAATDISLYYRQADMLYDQVGRRLLTSKKPDAKKFRERCRKRGIPDELLKDPDLWEFCAPRVIGAGSKAVQSITTQELLSVAPYLRSQVGQINLVEDFVQARGGPEAVSRYMPPYEDSSMPTRSHQIAQLENNDLVEGKGVIVSVEDWHVPHLESHFDYAEGQIDAVFANPNEQAVMSAMQAVPPTMDHIGNHMAYLKGDELFAKQFGNFQQRLKALVGKVKQLEGSYKAIMQEQQRQQAEQQKRMQELIDRGDQTELQKELAQIQADLQLRVYKENLNHQARVEKAVHGMQIAEAKAAKEIELMETKANAQ